MNFLMIVERCRPTLYRYVLHVCYVLCIWAVGRPIRVYYGLCGVSVFRSTRWSNGRSDMLKFQVVDHPALAKDKLPTFIFTVKRSRSYGHSLLLLNTNSRQLFLFLHYVNKTESLSTCRIFSNLLFCRQSACRRQHYLL